MKRLFWVAVGATVGVLVVRKLSRTAEQLTPQGLADQVAGQAAGIGAAIRTFGEEIRAGMVAREDEMRVALGLGDGEPNGHRTMDPATAARLAHQPGGQRANGPMDDRHDERWRDH